MFFNETAPHIDLTIVSSGQELILALEKNNNFDILLIETYLDNTPTLNLIRDLKSKDINIPFIILADNDIEDFSAEAFKLGAVDYISKSDNFLTFLLVSIEKTFLRSNLEKEYKIREQHLQQANEKITSIFSNLKETYFTKDIINNIFTYYTESCENVYGYTNDAFYNDPDLWLKLIYPEDLSYVKSFMDKLDQGMTVTFEHRIINLDGKIRWIKEKVTPSLDNGLLIRIDGIAADITERKISEEKLRESETRFRNSFEYAAIGMLIISTGGKFLEANKSYCEMVGYSEHELLSMSIDQITYKDDIDLSLTKMKQLQKSNFQLISFEKRYIHKSGALIWVKVNTTSYIGKDNKPLYFIAQIEDITERKKSEEKIKEQAALLDITTDAVLVINMENNIIFWNKGAEKLYDYTKEEIIGLNVIKKIYSLNISHFEQSMKSVLKDNQWDGELEYINKLNKKIVLDSKWTLMKDSKGNPLSILIVNNDITQKKYLEKEYIRIQRLESIGTLASGIAHDLNNILTPILMGVEILNNSLNEQKKQSVLKSMKISTQQGVELIKKMTIFSEEDKAYFQVVNINEFLKEIVITFNSILPKSIQIKLDFDNSILKLMADKSQLNQLFINILTNASDAMPNGGQLTVKLEKIYIDKHYAEAHLESHEGYYALIRIDDTGIGIEEKSINKVFEPFFTTKQIGKGTGLGLSTSNLIIKNHKGFINVYSELGKGTSFKIYLPLIIDEQSNIENEDANSGIILGSGELILVVDDEVFVREIIQDTLENYGYRVILASDGPEAINLYVKYKNEIQLVLMDINMPLMDGLSTIKVLNKIENKIKIIGMSGLASNQKRSENLTNYFLHKPFTNTKLLKLIYQVINSSESINSQNINQVDKDSLVSEEDKIKTEFLATISHEIKTPMNGVIGMTNLLRQTKLTNEQKEYIETIEKSENDLLKIINDILDFSKIESKMVELESNNFEIKNCIEEIFNDFFKKASAKNIDLVYRISPDIPKFVKGDVKRFKQIIYNLVNNGLKFIENGKLYISVELIKQDNNILTLKFLVQDTGIGINEHTISKLFKPFIQSDSSNKRKYGGTGLGLALCKKLIELMDGSIWVKSEIGVGSEFNFIIKLAKADELIEEKQFIEEKPIILDSDFAKHYPCKILLAEDNLINQKVAVKLFEKMGYKVDIANNGLETVKAVEKNQYNIIFMDIQMPEMDGIEATKYLLDKYPDTCPYIVALTANAAQNDSSFFIKLGMSDFIAKPVSINNLKRVLIKLAN